MIPGGLVAIVFGVAAEGKSLEDVARPLSVIAMPAETIFRPGSQPRHSRGRHRQRPTVPSQRIPAANATQACAASGLAV